MPVCNFAVNIEFLNSAPILEYSFAVNIEFPDSAPILECSFAVNIEILEFTLNDK
jgi:hypothetical protein